MKRRAVFLLASLLAAVTLRAEPLVVSLLVVVRDVVSEDDS